MTWSKQYTATVGIADVDTDGGVSLQTVLDELFMTWLPSRGWTTHKQASPPALGSGVKAYYWFEKQVQCIDNSYYNHRIQFTFDPAAVEHFGYSTWEDGVAHDTITPIVIATSPMLAATEGFWEFWTSDQDNDSFAILSKGGNNGVIGFMPPTGSIFPAADRGGHYPTANGPVFPCNGHQWWVLPGQFAPATPYLLTTSGSYSGVYQPAPIKLNFAATKNGVSSNSAPGFITTTNDIASIVNVRDGANSDLYEVNTMLIDGDYYITIGRTTNKLLLNTGTTDPQF